MVRVKIVGLQEIHYVDNVNNSDTRHIMYGSIEDAGSRLISIEFSNIEDLCPSGWMWASWAHVTVNFLDGDNLMQGMSYIPTVRPLIVDFPFVISETANSIDWDCDCDDFKNEIVTYSASGSDPYYPSGFYDINISLFSKTPRCHDNRLVWIIHGDIKTFHALLSETKQFRVYETNADDRVPAIITADIVVINETKKKKRKQIECDILPRLFSNPDIVTVKTITCSTPVKDADQSNPRHVWLLYGESGTGKTFLSSSLIKRKHIQIFETDSVVDGKLPDTIRENIIVVGNKWQYKFNDILTTIVPRLPDNTKIEMMRFKTHQRNFSKHWKHLSPIPKW